MSPLTTVAVPPNAAATGGVQPSTPAPAPVHPAGAGVDHRHRPPDFDMARTYGRQLRAIRHGKGWSLSGVEAKSGGRWKAVVVGSYERGDRHPSVTQVAELLAFYGHRFEVLGPDDVVLRPGSGSEGATIVWVVTAPGGIAIDCGDHAEAERVHRLMTFSRVGFRHISEVIYGEVAS
jgi:hypothetical protein